MYQTPADTAMLKMIGKGVRLPEQPISVQCCILMISISKREQLDSGSRAQAAHKERQYMVF